MSSIATRLDSVVSDLGRDPELAGAVARMESSDRSWSWIGSMGNLGETSPFFIASVTKLYTTALILRLSERGDLRLDDRLVDRVGRGLVKGLHTYRGTDLTDRITLRHLLAHTSGLPDYFMGRRPDGSTLERSIRQGVDMGWALDDVLAAARSMSPAFPPASPGRALYSDTNFQLLGRVIEKTTRLPYVAALQKEICEPLRLAETWLYPDPAEKPPVDLRYRRRILKIPAAMASFGPDGGIVTTVGDLMRFLRAFFEGELFDAAVFSELKIYHRIFFPLQYGVGFARFTLPRIFSPFAPFPELLGHSGLSGAFAFALPAWRIYLAGTVNNLARPDRPFRFMLRLLKALGR